MQLNKISLKFLAILRIVLGWMMLYAGLVKIFDPKWTAYGFLTHAQTFPQFFAWFALPQNIGWVNFINAWGLTLLGVSLILGFGVRLSSAFGTILMLLYYFPQNTLPFVTDGFIVEQHVIYALMLVFFAVANAGRFYGIDGLTHEYCVKKFPKLYKIWG